MSGQYTFHRSIMLASVLISIVVFLSAFQQQPVEALKSKKDVSRKSIVFDLKTPKVFYCPQEKPNDNKKFIVKAKPLEKLCEFQGDLKPKSAPSDCYNDLDETEFACEEKKRFMTVVKLAGKAFRFMVNRPIQRFNIESRVKKYEGRIPKPLDPNVPRIGNDVDQLVISASRNLKVEKDVQLIESTPKSSRPLPVCTNLQLSDPALIWEIDKVPPGRLSLQMFQEIMLNQLGDPVYWTTKMVAERYSIREEYAENLIKNIKQIRVIVSPRLKKLLDYTGKDNPAYMETKHLVYVVDKRLRSDEDKIYDKTFLPTDQLDEEVRELIEEEPADLQITGQEQKNMDSVRRITRRPEPLRIAPLNKLNQASISSQEWNRSSQQKRIEATSSKSQDKSDVT